MEKKTQASRRGFLWGAAATGAAATATLALPTAQPAADPTPEPLAKPEKGGGYRLSEHVKQYYQTTRI